MMKTKNGMIRTALLAVCLVGLSNPVIAQETPRGTVTDRFRQGLIDFTREMNAVVKNVKSVADAEKAEPRIAAAMDRLTSIVLGFVNNFSNMTREQGVELANLETLTEDPEVKKWVDKFGAAMIALEKEHPDAAAKFEEIGARLGKKFVEAMTEIRVRIQQYMEKHPPSEPNN